MNKYLRHILGSLVAVSTTALAGTPAPDDPAISALVASGEYDNELCVTAQRVILNADADSYRTIKEVAGGTTFMSEQMSANREEQSVTVAALLVTSKIGRKRLAVNAACKLVNQDRVNDVLELNLPQPAGTCHDVNKLTYAIALNGLSEQQRQRYLNDGVPLRFATDYKAAAGGEWIPSVISDFIKPVYAGDKLDYISVTAPSVQVPWPGEGGDWFEGVHSCKVITLAAMTRWMKKGAFDGSTVLFPRPRPKCVEPDSRTSTAGSCLLYMGPAGAQFCQDYSGNGWTEAAAREDCAIRHATISVWNSGGDNYDGGGGIFNKASCKDRDAVAEVGRDPVNLPDGEYLGTCVFRCNTPNEALYHQVTPSSIDPEGNMTKRCDLFLQVDW